MVQEGEYRDFPDGPVVKMGVKMQGAVWGWGEARFDPWLGNYSLHAQPNLKKEEGRIQNKKPQYHQLTDCQVRLVKM